MVNYPRGENELASLIRSFDWSKTPLGPISEWPNCLRAAVDIMLPSHAQIVIFWGNDYIALYNDAYAPTIGNKHPRALGRPARENWSELWSDLEPMLRRVLLNGETVSARDRPFYIERHGHPEDVYFDISYSPIHDDEGLVRGVFCIVSETTQRRRALEVERRLAAIIASSDDAILSTDLDMKILSWNAGAEWLYGYSAEEAIGMPVTVLVPDDRPDEEELIIEQIRRGERVEPHETKRRHKDGRLIDVSLTVSPVRDEDGRIVGASKIARDITERKAAERLQRVLMAELRHRVKNVLANVQAIARQTIGQSRVDREARDAFEARLRSLSSAHDLLTLENWNGADLPAVVADAIAPYQRDRFDVSGPSLRLPPRAVLALSLALHELATNAVKYGALSNKAGRVKIAWQVHSNSVKRLSLGWLEEGGPVVVRPTRRGFGSKLIENVLAAELKGSVEIVYHPAGIRCDVEAPLDVEWDG
jgi:PAS domain S-box-containing protein